jgi:hypothetical protein
MNRSGKPRSLSGLLKMPGFLGWQSRVLAVWMLRTRHRCHLPTSCALWPDAEPIPESLARVMRQVEMSEAMVRLQIEQSVIHLAIGKI